ncbi:MAG: hypothetical protein HYX68_06870 [Planctomycetes bacterium]|nr:hypothetical protein [Planctomycetota bacterium]
MCKTRFRLIATVAAFSASVNVANAGSDEVLKAIQNIANADSYAFTSSDTPGTAAVEGRYQKGRPIAFNADRIDFFRKGKILVYQQGAAWQRTRTGTLSDPLRILIPSAKVRAARLPHEDLVIVSKVLKKTTNEKVKGHFVVRGDFGADTAKQLARTEDRDLARGGTAKLWLDARGRLVRYEIAIRVQGVRGNAEVDGVMTRTATIAELGKVKVVVPAGARKALE